MVRTAVTPSAVRSFLERTMDGNNYHLLFGLHLLKPEHFKAVADALLNGDAQVEDLVRLGAFSEPEAEAFIRDTLGSWVSPAVAVPAASFDGYAYLTRDLDLSTLLRAAREAEPGPAASSVLGVSIPVGGEDGFTSVEAAYTVFCDTVLDEALGGRAFAEVFPSTDAELALLPLANADDARRARFAEWFRGLFGPLTEPFADHVALSADTAAGVLLSVGPVDSRLRRSPALAEWILATPYPDDRVRLLLHREAVERTVVGPYTADAVEARVEALQTAPGPGYVATAPSFAKLDFQLSVLRAAVDAGVSASEATLAKLSALEDVVAALHSHRFRLRTFVADALRLAQGHLRGHYPAR